jgi:SAM-dependent methyltransferase
MRFDAFAHSYDLHAAPQREFAARVARFIGPRPGLGVVELGAGTGALTRHILAEVSGNVLASDGSRAMVNLGREAVPGATWRVLDAFAGQVPRAEVQVSSGLLQWAEDPVVVLKCWHQAIRPGGTMIHALACNPCLAEWRGLVSESPLRRWHDTAEWLELFESAGLRILRHQLWVQTFHFDSALNLARAMHRSGVTGRARLGAGRLRKALREYESRYREVEGVVSTWAWLVIEAQAN